MKQVVRQKDCRLSEFGRIHQELTRSTRKHYSFAVTTAEEIAKTREQAKREIEAAGKAARHELRQFAAEESVRIAEQILQREMKPEDDVRLTSLTVQELGRTQS